ncbi:MAG: hypothetical protein WCJ89_08345 [Actinomycetes bacterium]
MGNRGTGIAIAVLIPATIITIDLIFFRDQPFRRLIANICVVGLYAAVYFALIKK